MTHQVLYYTRSGYSQAVAQKIAAQLHFPLVQVTDDQNWKGFFGFLRGGYYASSGKPVTITVHGTVDPQADLVVVAPLWAGKVMPAMKALFETVPKNRVHYVVTSNGVALKEREGFKSVTDLVRRFKNEDEVLGHLYEKLQAPG